MMHIRILNTYIYNVYRYSIWDLSLVYFINSDYFDYKVSVKLDEIRKISKVSIEGDLQARGLSTERQFHIKDFLDNELENSPKAKLTFIL